MSATSSVGGVTLVIEASTYAGSVAVIGEGLLRDTRETAMRGVREERLMPTVAAALASAGVSVRDLARVVCGSGPGSFTSLRIAASIAKGIALSVARPLVAVPSPLLMLGAVLPGLGAGRYLTVLEAMRGECFVACYHLDPGQRIHAVADPALVARADVQALAETLGATTLGAGMTIEAHPEARGALVFGVAFAMPHPVVLETWEPDYGRLAEAQVTWERAHGRPLVADS